MLPRSRPALGLLVAVVLATAATALTTTTACRAQAPRSMPAAVPAGDTASAGRPDARGRSAALATADGRAVYVESPGILVQPSGTVLLGWPTFTWRAPSSTSADVVLDSTALAGVRVHDSTAEPLPLPPGVHALVAPRVGPADPSSPSGLAVLWGERAAGPDATTSFVQHLWAADYVDGRWSPPTRLLDATMLPWGRSLARSALGPDGTLHAVASGLVSPTAGAALTYLRHDAHGWSTHRVAALLASMPTVAPANDSTVLIAHLIGAGQPPAVLTTIALVGSTDRGGTWQPLAPLATRPHARVTELTLVPRGPTGGVVALWLERPLDDLARPTTLVAATSADGRQWSAPVTLALPGAPTALTALPTAGGQVFIVVAGSAGPGGAAVHAVCAGPAGLTPADAPPLAGVRSVTPPTVGPLPGNAGVVVATTTTVAHGGDAYPRTVLTTVRPGCP